MSETTTKQFIVEPVRAARAGRRFSNKRYIERQANLALGIVVRQSALDNDAASGGPHLIAGAPIGTQPLDLYSPLADEPGMGAAQTEPRSGPGAEARTPGINLESPDVERAKDEVRRPTGAPESFRHWQPAKIFSHATLKSGMGAPETESALAPTPTPTPAPAPAPAPAPDLGAMTRRRAIVLDPDADVRRLTACLLRQLGYEVTESESAEDAIASSDKAAADLLVAESRLSGDWTGEALATRLRRTAPNLRVILTSDTGLGAANSNLLVLLKPFGLDQLADLVNQDSGMDGPVGRGSSKAPGDGIPLDLEGTRSSAAIAL